jgi:cytochrome P450
MVAPAIYLMHHRPALYPRPDSFDAERFLTFKPGPSEWLPFGGGLRKCIGAAFAVYEMKMVLASLLARIDVRLAATDVRPTRRGVTIMPSGGLPVVVAARKPRDVRAGGQHDTFSRASAR